MTLALTPRLSAIDTFPKLAVAEHCQERGHAIVFGRAASCTKPVLARPNARLLFVVHKSPKHERERARRDLFDYSCRDALVMVRLVETLEGLGRVAP